MVHSWTPQEIELLRSLAAQGWPDKAVAAKIGGISAKQVLLFRHNHGISNGSKKFGGIKPRPTAGEETRGDWVAACALHLDDLINVYGGARA